MYKNKLPLPRKQRSISTNQPQSIGSSKAPSRGLPLNYKQDIKLSSYLDQIKATKPQKQEAPLNEGLLGTGYDLLTREQLLEKLLVTEELLKKLYKENMSLKE